MANSRNSRMCESRSLDGEGLAKAGSGVSNRLGLHLFTFSDRFAATSSIKGE